MKIVLLESAERDLKDGFRFYESQQKGLGAYFLESLLSDIDSLILFAGIHSVHFELYYRSLSKRFPFAVYYQLENDLVKVFAVIDCRRDPEWLKGRL